MDRKKFLKNAVLSAAGVVAGSGKLKLKNVKPKESTYDKMKESVVGFNHIPNNEIRTMKTVLHRASTRGHAAKGFGMHPHDNMEIISIPLKGALEHKDSMGNTVLIKAGEVQAMSAGKGVYHSEYNKNDNAEVEFLQIWLFPNKRDVTPRYDQISIIENWEKNQLNQILSPSKTDEGVWIHQNAWFHMGELDSNTCLDYSLKNQSNGVYAFILEGNVTIEGQDLHRRDGFGMWNMSKISIQADSEAKILLMEVPMTINQ